MEPNIVERAAQMFPKLTPAQVERISSVGHRRDVRAGEVLFEVGEQNTRFFVVLSGAIEIVRPVGDREEPVIVHGPASSPARSTCSRRAAAWCAARAAADGAVIAVDREDLRTLVQRDSELSEILMRAFILRRVALVAQGDERPGAARLAPLGQHAAHQGVPDPQRPALHLPGRRDRSRRAGAARSLPRRRRRRAGGHLPRRPRAQEPDRSRSLASASASAPTLDPDAGARRRHRRRRAGRAGGRGLRRVRGAGRAGAREHRARRAGRHQLAHRELPRLPHRHLRPGAGRARAHAGREVRRRGRHRPHRRPPRLRQPALSRSIWPTARWCGRARSSSPPARKYRKLDLPSLARFEGAGVYYSATHLEAQLCEGEEIAIVGGGNSAGPGGGVPVAASPRACTCWCAARAWPRACRAT